MLNDEDDDGKNIFGEHITIILCWAFMGVCYIWPIMVEILLTQKHVCNLQHCV